VKIILDFQLLEHEKFLSSFNSLFKEIDTDNNGILNEEELRELLQRMTVIHQSEEIEQIENLLNIIDP